MTTKVFARVVSAFIFACVLVTISPSTMYSWFDGLEDIDVSDIDVLHESNLPGTNSLENVNKYQSLNAGGDLTLTIPIANIPGKIPFGINLTYQSGIKIDQSATWVGLGWNLGNWSVKRIPIHGDDPESILDPYSKNTRNDINDKYMVNIPGQSMVFINTNNRIEPHFIPEIYSNYKLVVVQETRSYCYDFEYFEPSYFVLIDEHATKYIFKKPLRRLTRHSPGGIHVWDNCMSAYHDGIKSFMANSEWLLTAILSHDYVDNYGDTLNPIDGPSPQIDNSGSWVAFTYSGMKNSDEGEVDYLKSCSLKPINGGYRCYNYRDTTEVAYLRKIVTPSTLVQFDLITLQKFRTQRYMRSGISDQSRVKNGMLSKVTIYAYSGIGTAPTGPELYSAAFTYEKLGEHPLKDYMFDKYSSYSGIDGEPALRALTYSTYNPYNSTSNGYAQDANIGGLENKLTFNYYDNQSLYNAMPTYYHEFAFDSMYINWTRGGPVKTPMASGITLLGQACNPIYMDDWFRNDWGCRDYFGYYYFEPHIWSLKHMTDANGLTTEYRYEPDVFGLNIFDKDADAIIWHSGGPRVSLIQVQKCEIGLPDIVGTEEIYLDYISASVTDEALGTITCMPPVFHKFISRFETPISVVSYQGSTHQYSENSIKFQTEDYDSKVQYPIIRCKFEDKCHLDYLYVVPKHNTLWTSSYHEFLYISGQVLDTLAFNYGIWQNKSMLGGQFVGHNVYGKNLDGPLDTTLIYSSKKPYPSEERIVSIYEFSADSLFNGYHGDKFDPAEGSWDFDFPNGDAIAASYYHDIVEQSVYKDGSKYKEVYSFDSIYRLASKTGYANDHDILTKFDYAANWFLDTTYWECWILCSLWTPYGPTYWCGADSVLPIDSEDYDPYNPAHLMKIDTAGPDLMAAQNYVNSLSAVWQFKVDSLGDTTLHSYTNKEYRSDFPSQNLSGENRIWYISKVKKWHDLDLDNEIDSLIAPSEILCTEILDRDAFGNILQVRHPNGRTDGYCYNIKGIEAEIKGINGYNYAVSTFEHDPGDEFAIGNDCSIDSAVAFTGTKSVKLDGIPNSLNNGLEILKDQVAGGFYIAEAWGKCSEANKLGITLQALDNGIQDSETSYITEIDTWQLIACTLSVTEPEDLYVSLFYDNGLTGESGYFDDLRVYPAGALVSSYTYDNLLRETSVSGANNIPTRTYYDQFGQTYVQSDYKNHPIEGTESFIKNTESIVDWNNDVYDRKMPNISYDFQSPNGGLVDDFSTNSLLEYELEGDNILIWDEDKKWAGFYPPDDGNQYYDDLIIPVDSFSNGFMFFDCFRTNGGQKVSFGFENDSDTGYSVLISGLGQLKCHKYFESDYGSSSALFETYDWPVFYSQQKYRYGLGKQGDNLFIFVNGDCVQHIQDSEIENFTQLRIRLETSGESWPDKYLWIDNLIFYSDPVVTANYINAFGNVKQSQVFDGDSLIINGRHYAIDGKVDAEFLPISVPINISYGNNNLPTIDHISPYDFVYNYVDEDHIATWKPTMSGGINALSTTSLLHDYYVNGSNTPNCWWHYLSNMYFIPYTQFNYYDDMTKRPWFISSPGPYRFGSEEYWYKRLRIPLDGFSPNYYNSENVSYTDYTDENGNDIYTYKDNLGRIIYSQKDKNGINAVTKYYYDFFGNNTLTVKPDGDSVLNTYTNLGLLNYDYSYDYGSNEYFYDQMGNLRFSLSSSDNENNRYRYYKYDLHNRLIEEGVYNNLSAELPTWENAYDPDFPDDNSPNTIILSEYEYDSGEFGRGRLTKSINYPSGKPDSASWESFAYDAYGNLVEKSQFNYVIDDTDARTFMADYDLLGNVTDITYPNNLEIHYDYNMAGQLNRLSSSDNKLAVSYEYWPFGKVKRKTLGTPDYLGPAQVVDYEYNARGWLTSINDGTADLLATGNNDHFGLKLTYLDGAHQGMCNEDSSSCTFPEGYKNGNISSYYIVSSQDAAGSHEMMQRFRYDALDRLTGVLYTSSGVPDENSFAYDKNGNIEYISTSGGDTFDYQYFEIPNSTADINRLEKIVCSSGPDMTFQYTPYGSITSYDHLGMHMRYNYKEQLAGRDIDDDLGGDTLRYWYNTSGQRVAKQFWKVFQYECGGGGGGGIEDPILPLGGLMMMGAMGGDPGGPTYCTDTAVTYRGYYYLGDKLLSTYLGPLEAQLTGNYIYANGEKVAYIKNDSLSIRYYLHDHLGSVMATVSPSGSMCDRYQYLPWGKLHLSQVSANTVSRFMYTGQELDEELDYDLYYYGSRYYDPELKIFTQIDPRRHDYPDWGPYVYTLNNPMKYVDPDGGAVAMPLLWSWGNAMGGSAAAAGGASLSGNGATNVTFSDIGNDLRAYGTETANFYGGIAAIVSFITVGQALIANPDLMGGTGWGPAHKIAEQNTAPITIGGSKMFPDDPDNRKHKDNKNDPNPHTASPLNWKTWIGSLGLLKTLVTGDSREDNNSQRQEEKTEDDVKETPATIGPEIPCPTFN